MRTLEIVYKDITRVKVTVAKTRVTIKFPLRFKGNVSTAGVNRLYNNLCAAFTESDNTARARLANDTDTSLYFQYENGKHACTVSCYMFTEEVYA